MQILLAVIYGAAVGALAHYTLPGRDTRGPALAPMAAAVAGGAVWTILTWAGLPIGSAWLWLAAAAAPAVVAYAGVAALTRARHAHDARERVRLDIV